MNTESKQIWLSYARMMEPISTDCMCIDPPCEDHEDKTNRDQNDPSCHSQYCPIYLYAYALALGEGREVPA